MLEKPTTCESVPFFWTVLLGQSIRYTGKSIYRGRVYHPCFRIFKPHNHAPHPPPPFHFLIPGYGEGYTEIIFKGKVEDRKFLALYIKWATTPDFSWRWSCGCFLCAECFSLSCQQRRGRGRGRQPDVRPRRGSSGGADGDRPDHNEGRGSVSVTLWHTHTHTRTGVSNSCSPWATSASWPPLKGPVYLKNITYKLLEHIVE